MKNIVRSLSLLALLAVFSAAAVAQVSTVVSSPGYTPPGVRQTEGQVGVDLGRTPESMAKTSAALNIPEGVTIPVIDGTLSAGEWTDAVEVIPATVVTPGCKAWFKMDACNLYIAAIVMTPSIYTGNSTMINIWFDLDQDGTWDTAGELDGNLALPAPGALYPSNEVGSFGYASLAGWTTSSTGRLRFHYPWSTVGMVPPAEQITVKRTTFSASETHIEAIIDYKNSPLKLENGNLLNMRIQWYAGYYSPAVGGTVQIQAQWPTVNTSAYFSGPTPSELNADAQAPIVIAPPDIFDVADINVLDNPQFSSKAYYIGGNMTVAVDYTSIAPPTTTNAKINIYGPHPSSALYASYNTTINATQTSGTAQVTLPVNFPTGFYRIEVIVDDPWVCGIRKITEINNILIMLPGQTPCTVWPGDVNRDDVVNYGDRSSLNNYIYAANLNPTWLNGPGRLAPSYPDAFSEYEWTGQAAAPWLTPEGCHMDADGNGVVNNFDYIAIKMNWLRSLGDVSGKDGAAGIPVSFGMNQNFPNPFNPSTTIQLALPERATVRLIISDMLGRTVATLVDGDLDAGVRAVQFDASGLASGTYLATAVMTGIESGLTFSQTISMSLTK